MDRWRDAGRHEFPDVIMRERARRVHGWAAWSVSNISDMKSTSSPINTATTSSHRFYSRASRHVTSLSGSLRRII